MEKKSVANGLWALNQEDAALGCVIGAFTGHVIGRTYMPQSEGSPPSIPSYEALTTMLRNPKAACQAITGQFGLDVEMAMALAWALRESGSKFKCENLAHFYIRWIKTNPLGTTRAKV
jgi:ADP-ribosylglycohydrolase